MPDKTFGGGLGGTVALNKYLKATQTGVDDALLGDDGSIVTLPTGKTLALVDADALSIGGKIVPQHRVVLLGNMNAASLSADSPAFICDRAYKVISIQETHGHIGGASALAMPEKLTGTTAPGSGTALLTAGFDLFGVAANTVQTGTLSATVADYTFAAGDRLGIKLSGTLTALTGLNIVVKLQAV